MGINKFKHFIVVSLVNVLKNLCSTSMLVLLVQQAQIAAWWLVMSLENHLSIWMCSDDVVVVTNPPPPKLVMGITGNR